MGLIDREQERLAANKQLSVAALVDEFKKSLLGRTPQYVLHTISRLNRIIAGCGFERLGEITPQPVVACLQQIRTKDDLGARTYNHYLQAIDTFCNWCVETKRLASNPLTGVDRLNCEIDVRHKRRALTAQEFVSLVKAARASKSKVQRYSGEQRARIYIFSYLTGLRRKEMGSLTPRSFDLDAKPPTMTIEASVSKHRKKDVLPLHPELVELLPGWMQKLKPTEKLFPKLEKRKAWLMVKTDLEAAGLEYENADGIADFHAAGRHTHITGLLRNGATLPEAQKLARHSDIRMTMRYTHIGIDDQARAVAKLPGAALQMRCISGVSDEQRLSSDGNPTEPKKRDNPCEGKGYDADRRQMSPVDKVEDRGLEPLASCMPCKRSPN